jgi:hypothetical protein
MASYSIFGAFWIVLIIGVLLYLTILHRALEGVPDEAKQLAQSEWTKDLVKAEYGRIAEGKGTNIAEFIPPKLGRRYVVTGGCGACN